jgi:hypothetical protein
MLLPFINIFLGLAQFLLLVEFLGKSVRCCWFFLNKNKTKKIITAPSSSLSHTKTKATKATFP